MHKIMQS